MKPTKRLASQIAGTSSPHSIKVKVIDKTNMHTSSANSSLESQIITFADEEGTQLKTILYNEHLELFEDAIDDEIEYEINNAELTVLPGQDIASPAKPVYHMYFNRKTTIQPVYGPNSAYLPKYILLASIPRELSLDARYDVLGIVVYVGQKYQVPRHSGQPWDVCEVIIIDHSSEQIMIVTVWGPPGINVCMTLQSIAPTFPVIGFTALRMSYQKGFSLATTHLTFINLDPEGEDAAALRAWGEAHTNFLTAKNHQICEVRRTETQRFITTIQTLLEKKAESTLQEENHWLRVQLKDFDHTKLRLYLGCSECGTGNNEDIEVAYTCTGCLTEKAISTPRIAITFEATDETGAYFFTALTDNAEKLLEVNATTLYLMLPQEKEDYLGQVERQIRSTPIYIQVVPAKSLSRTQVLCWLLNQLVMKPTSKKAKELADMPTLSSIKVKVIHKTEVHSSLVDSTMDYQLYTFQDEEGAKLRAVLYADSLAKFEDVMEDQMEYEISNARVRVIPGLDWEYPTDQIYELHFNINTHVEPIVGNTSHDAPQYMLLGSIPRFNSVTKHYDVLGIIIYMDQDCKITKTNGETQDICEILIIDQSSEQIMIVTALNEEAIKKLQKLQNIAASFPVVGFTALRPSYRKGFSLEITQKTSINLNPTTEEATALRAWGDQNMERLIAKSCHVFQVRHPETERIITTVEWLLHKKIKNTLQEERYWLRVKLNTYDPINFSLYLGCSNCNSRTNEDMGVTYTCHVCFKKNVTSYPRMAVTFEAADQTGSYFFTALTENAEIMLKITATELFTMLPQEREPYLAQAKKELSNTTIYIQVSPTPCLSLSTDRVMLWVLEKVALT